MPPEMKCAGSAKFNNTPLRKKGSAKDRIVTLKTQLPYSPATPKSAAPIRAAATAADASGMVVTMDTANIPSTPEEMPVKSATRSTLWARNTPATITPNDTRLKISQARLRVIPGSSPSSPSSTGRRWYTIRIPKTYTTSRTMEEMPICQMFASIRIAAKSTASPVRRAARTIR